MAIIRCPFCNARLQITDDFCSKCHGRNTTPERMKYLREQNNSSVIQQAFVNPKFQYNVTSFDKQINECNDTKHIKKNVDTSEETIHNKTIKEPTQCEQVTKKETKKTSVTEQLKEKYEQKELDAFEKSYKQAVANLNLTSGKTYRKKPIQYDNPVIETQLITNTENTTDLTHSNPIINKLKTANLKTISELQNWCDLNIKNVEQYNFFIGINKYMIGAYGIWQNQYNGNYLVYNIDKNRNKIFYYNGANQEEAVKAAVNILAELLLKPVNTVQINSATNQSLKSYIPIQQNNIAIKTAKQIQAEKEKKTKSIIGTTIFVILYFLIKLFS